MYPRAPLSANPARVLSDTHSLSTLPGPGHAQLLLSMMFPLGTDSARNPICWAQNYGLFLAAALPSPLVQTQTSTQSGAGPAGAPGFGVMLGKLTSGFSLSGAVTFPVPGRKNQKCSGADLEGNLPSILQFSPKTACQALMKRPLCFPSQIRVWLGLLMGPCMHLSLLETSLELYATPCAYSFASVSVCLSLFLCVCCVCLCVCVSASVYFG